LSSLVEFEDLGDLDPGDLRAVLRQVDPEQVVVALIGATAGIRRQLLTKLPASSASQLQAQLAAHEPVTADSALSAQRAVVDALCYLSRGGHIAFDDPADIFDLVA